MTLSWDAPAFNCDGSPLLDLSHYLVPVFRAVIVGMSLCSADPEVDFLCPRYALTLDNVRVEVAELVLPDPGPGEVLGYEMPVAFDMAGRSSEECGTLPAGGTP